MTRYAFWRIGIRLRDWLLAGTSSDPVQRALEPLVRVAMLIGVATSLGAVWLGFAFAPDPAAYARYAPYSTALQVGGLVTALWVLQRHGPIPATRAFVAFVVVTLAAASLTLGIATVSGSAVRLIVPIILLALTVEAREAVLWTLALLAAATVGVIAPTFDALPPYVRDIALDRLVVAAIVMLTSLTILLAFRRALRDAIHQGAVTAKARQAERMAAHLESELLHRRELVANLTTGVAHDLANVVQGATINVALIAPHVTSAEGEAALHELRETVTLAGTLMRRLLAAGRMPPTATSNVEARAFLSRLDALVPPLLGRARRYVAEVRTQRRLRVDADRLEHVLLNLAMNARDAMPQRGTLTVAIDDGPSDESVVIAVRDTGVGMPPEIAARAFEPFFSTKSDGRGTGLGLAFVARVIDDLHGSIAIESAPGAGTTVKLTLPAA